tara:strand:- start:1090 stop:1881 length:792 start_codon:yes stop_codon:yes gene_type:complete
MNKNSLHTLTKGLKEIIIFYELASNKFFDSKEHLNVYNIKQRDELIEFSSYVNQERISQYFLGAIFHVASSLKLEYSARFNRNLDYLDIALPKDNLSYQDVFTGMFIKAIEKMLDRGPQLLIPTMFESFAEKNKNEKTSTINRKCFELGWLNCSIFFNVNHPNSNPKAKTNIRNTAGENFYVDISVCDPSHIESLINDSIIDFSLDKASVISSKKTTRNEASDEIFEDPLTDNGEWYDIQNSEQYRKEMDLRNKEITEQDLPF